MIIIGAGYAGLLAAAINPQAVVYEAMSADECVKNHQAVFRMKSDKIGQQLGIEFKKVKVFKSIWHKGNNVNPTPNMIHMYSKKVSGNISNRSISNIECETRYIPPVEFWQELEDRCPNVVFGAKVEMIGIQDEPTISTMPLPSLLSLKKIPVKHALSPRFESHPIFVTKFKIRKCDSYATVYYPDLDMSIYRSTINGDELIVESISPIKDTDEELMWVFCSMGIDESDVSTLSFSHKQLYGKITEIDNKTRGELILDLTISHNIYSLGRYATWRPKVMLDDVLDDIFVIRKLIQKGKYSSNLYQQS